MKSPFELAKELFGNEKPETPEGSRPITPAEANEMEKGRRKALREGAAEKPKEKAESAAGESLESRFDSLSADDQEPFLDEVFDRLSSDSDYAEEFAARDKAMGSMKHRQDFKIQLRSVIRSFAASSAMMKPGEAFRNFYEIAASKAVGPKAAAKKLEAEAAKIKIEGPKAELLTPFEEFAAGKLDEAALYELVWQRIREENPEAIQARLENLAQFGRTEEDLKEDLARQTRKMLGTLSKLAKPGDEKSASAALDSFYDAAYRTATALPEKRRKAA